MDSKQLIKELAKKYNVTEKEVYKAVRSQFHFVELKMKTFDETRLPFFGVFKVNKRQKQLIDKNNGK